MPASTTTAMMNAAARRPSVLWKGLARQMVRPSIVRANMVTPPHAVSKMTMLSWHASQLELASEASCSSLELVLLPCPSSSWIFLSHSGSFHATIVSVEPSTAVSYATPVTVVVVEVDDVTDEVAVVAGIAVVVTVVSSHGTAWIGTPFTDTLSPPCAPPRNKARAISAAATLKKATSTLMLPQLAETLAMSDSPNVDFPKAECPTMALMAASSTSVMSVVSHSV